MIKKTWKIIAGIVAGIFGLIFIFGKKSNNKKAEQAKKAAPKKAAPKKSVKSAKANIKKKIRK